MSAKKEQHDQEQYDPEIDAIFFKTKQSFQNCASAAVEQSLAIAPTTNNKKQLYEDYEDFSSIKGSFSWKLIAKIWIPVVTRAIDGKSYMFVSTRMAENLLLKKYLSYFNTDIYSCTSIRSHFMTNSEAILLNEINQNQCDFFFGNELFYGEEDHIVHLEDIQEFYTFLEICYKTLIRNINIGRKKKCGFIRINSESIVPFCKQDNLTFIPLFYFGGNIEDLKHRAEKIQKWNLPYLKFCCKIQGIKDHYFASDSCLMASLDEIKNYYSIDTHFKEFWPSRINNTRFLNNNNSTNVNPSGSWFRKPPGVVCVIPHTLAPLATVIRLSMPVMENTNQNKRLANKMSSAMSQGSGLKNRIIHVVTSPPFDYSGNTASVMGQCMKTIYNPMANSNMMSHSNQMQQIYRQCSINNSQDQQLELQQQQPLQITISQTPLSYSGHSELGRLTNTQLHDPLRNAMLIIITPDTEIVDFSSLPSNPIPPTVLETSPCPIVLLKLRKIPELNETNNKNTAAFKVNNFYKALHPHVFLCLTNAQHSKLYAQLITLSCIGLKIYFLKNLKIQMVKLQGGTFHCINLKPYIYSNLLATLDDFVQIQLPSYTAARIAYILNKKFKITLFSGNSEQLAVLRENRCFGSIYSEYTPMALLHDITCVWEPLKKLLMEEDQNIYQSAGESSKRRRTR